MRPPKGHAWVLLLVAMVAVLAGGAAIWWLVGPRAGAVVLDPGGLAAWILVIVTSRRWRRASAARLGAGIDMQVTEAEEPGEDPS